MIREDDSEPMVREAMVEGIFYPADRPELSATIQGLLSRSATLPGIARLIVSPHGSFDFSGAVMADAYKAASAYCPQRIIVIGSCFHQDCPTIFLPESGLFRTPLDDSPVDSPLLQRLLATSPTIVQNDLPHLQEHSIEVQLPFIQYLFPQIPILPILLGNSSEVVFKSLVTGLSTVISEIGGTTLVIISANMSGVLDRTQAHREAEYVLDMITGGKSQEIIDAASRKEICRENAAALASAAFFAQDGDLIIVARDSSLPVHYDPTNVVEYAALALF